MKVYVDELPKDCIDCPCESEYYCNLLNEDIGCLKWGELHQNCPLQSISDYTKQVRKEVCEEIYNKCCKKIWMNDDGFDCVTIDNVEEILDQIEKGE